jgi:hypothetical protein
VVFGVKDQRRGEWRAARRRPRAAGARPLIATRVGGSGHQTRNHGLQVFASGNQLEEVLRSRAVVELIISSAKIQGNGLDRVTEICRRLDVPIRRASFRFE